MTKKKKRKRKEKKKKAQQEKTEKQKEQKSKTLANYIEVVDELIFEYYEGLIKSIRELEIYKLGEFVKMVELKRKISPADADQKKFWNKIQIVRQKALKEKDEQRPADKDASNSIVTKNTNEANPQ